MTTSNITCRIFARTFTKKRGQSDGMVGRFSSHLGTVIGDDYPLDHFDIVNQHLGLVGKRANPVGLFLEHTGRLKSRRPLTFLAVVRDQSTRTGRIGSDAMSDKELYEIEYTLAGEHHVDVIENLDVPIIEIVHELALKHHVALDDDPLDDGIANVDLPHVAGITDVSIHTAEDAQEA